MSEVNIFWDPNGLVLDSLGRKKFRRITDGDTPYVEMPIRMLSIDTPEVHYPGNKNPAKHDEKFLDLAGWIQAGKAPVSDELAAYLLPRLATGAAGTLHKQQGENATQAFQQLLDLKLTKPNGSKRTLFLYAADQPFDQYGRLLAYMAPSYSSKELVHMSYHDRATFNLHMVESGWAASFPIYPSLPKYRDLVMLQQGGKKAFGDGLGAWEEAHHVLTGYEFRMCYRLWDLTRKLEQGKKLSTRERSGWVRRYCVDMTTRGIYEPQDYFKVKPYNRVFVWPQDVGEAVAAMNLLPGQ